MNLTGITFDTERGGASVKLDPPPVDPENPWQLKGVVREPACFPLSELMVTPRIVLSVSIHSSRPPAERLWIDAMPHAGDRTVYAAIPPTMIEPGPWPGGNRSVRIVIDLTPLLANGVAQYHGAWQWRYGYDHRRDVFDLGVSEHFLFVTMARPQPPWADRRLGLSEVRPWIGALMRACDWARGATTCRQAAVRITEKVFALGTAVGNASPRYRYSPESTNYIGPGIGRPMFFKCGKFLRDLADCAPERPFQVSCVETAATVIAFSNLLGCSMSAIMLNTGGCIPFRLNALKPLGLPDSSKTPEFQFHLVAAEEGSLPDLSDSLVFDATLQVDTDDNPGNPRHVFELPTGMPLGLTTARPGRGMFFPQLVAAGSILSCGARKGQPFRVGLIPSQEATDVCAIVRFLRYLGELQHAGGPLEPGVAGPTTFEIKGYDGEVLFTDEPGVPREGLPKVPRHSQTIYRRQAPERSGPVLQADFWTDPDPSVTKSFMAELLAELEVPPEPLLGYRYVAYSISGGTTIYVLLAGATARLSSIGSKSILVVDIVAHSDTLPI